MDTGAFIALLWQRDRAHAACRDHLRRLRTAGDALLTSNLVLAETATRLRYDAGLGAALAFRTLVDEAVRTGQLSVRHSDPALDAKAWDVMERYRDQQLSFADCTGAVVAQEARVGAVFGLDSDFVVLGFTLEPSA